MEYFIVLITFKTKFYGTKANNSFQPLPVFCRKELHLRCCIGLELSIVTSTKIMKGIGCRFFETGWLNCGQCRTNQYKKKEHDHHVMYAFQSGSAIELEPATT